MKKQTNSLKKYTGIILQVVVIGVSLAVIGLVLFPQINNYLQNRSKVTELQSQTAAIEGKVQQLQAIDPQSTQDNLKVVLTVLPKDPNVLDAVSTIQNLAALSGLGVNTLSYGNGTKGATDSFKIATELVGPVTNVNALLKKLNQSPRIIQVESIEVDSSKGSANASLPFVIYFKPPPSAGIPQDQAVQPLTDQEKKLLSDLTAGLNTQTVGTASADINSIQLGKDDPFK